MQAKLTVGRPDDAYEREADAAASRIESGQTVDRISRLPAGGLERSVHRQPEADEDEAQTAAVQRKCAECEDEESAQRQVEEEEESLQTSPLQRQEEEGEAQASPLQRQEEEEEDAQASSLQRQEEAQALPLRRQEMPEEDEEPLQMKAADEDEEPVQMRPATTEPGLDTGRAARAMRGPAGQPADPRCRRRWNTFGADFSGVRVHTGGAARGAQPSTPAPSPAAPTSTGPAPPPPTTA